MPKIDFEKGKFQTFRATTKVHLGQLGKDIAEGEEVEYDGQTLRIAGETFQNFTALKAAVKIDWLVPTSDQQTQYVPTPANITARPAIAEQGDGRNKFPLQTVNDEERLVGNVGTANLGQREGKLVEEGVSFDKTVKTAQNVSEGISFNAEIKTAQELPISQPDSPSEGRVIARLASPAGKKTLIDASTASKVDQEIRRLDSTDGSIPPKVEYVEPKPAPTVPASVPSLDETTPFQIVIWSLDQPWKDRLKRAVVEFGHYKKALEQIYQIESKEVQDGIKRFWELRRKQAAVKPA